MRFSLVRLFLGPVLVILLGVFASNPTVSDEVPVTDTRIRIMSWNISDDAFVSQKRAFRLIMQWANPDIVLLDEVAPSANTEELMNHLAALRPGEDETWNVSVGVSGGRQRTLIATRESLTPLPEFLLKVPYLEADQRKILDGMSSRDLENPNWSMDGGIPVNGAIIQVGDRRLLTVIADLQCCGEDPESWQELRRRVEAREIRSLIREVLETNAVDGVVFAGDFNMVNSTFPMALLLGPYPKPHSSLIPAEIYHSNGDVSWTWDGRGMPFPSNTLDYQLYSPHGLKIHSGSILDAEGSPSELRQQFELEANTSSLTGRHRPLVVEYSWN